MSSLAFILIVFSKPAAATLWPRLITYLPKPSCRAELDPTRDVIGELTTMLELSHPLVQRYLTLHTRDDRADHAFHVDLRLLALIYGDQPDFDLRRRDRERPFDVWLDGLSGWPVRSKKLRAELAGRFATHLADLDWSYDHTIPGSTVYLKGFNVGRAFRSDVNMFWNSMIGRHWDVDDKEGIALCLHQRIELLRRRLAEDPRVREGLEARLTARFGRGNLINVTARTRGFINAYLRYLEAQPMPRPMPAQDYVKRIFKRY